MFGQELNDETYAVCRSDMMLKGQDASHIVPGNSFSEDGHAGRTFDYLLANPPFGVEWKKVEAEVRKEEETKGFSGRFGAGLPRVNDGSRSHRFDAEYLQSQKTVNVDVSAGWGLRHQPGQLGRADLGHASGHVSGAYRRRTGMPEVGDA